MKIFRLGMALAVLLFGTAAFAGNGGRATANATSRFYTYLYYQVANTPVTFSTSSLSVGGDTVIHVQDYVDPQNGFIAGNDDFNGALSSQVTVPGVSSARYLQVIVRAYAAGSSGTCSFNIQSATDNITIPNVTFGGESYFSGDLASGAHVTTAELQGGASDTVLLAVSAGNPSHAIGFDDDDGVGYMSWLHLNEACPSCQIVIANFSATGSLSTRVVWDDDADSVDSDGDGLGNALEVAIASNPYNADSDADGIPDAWELLGKPEDTNGGPPVKFPFMGGDVVSQDLFMELDWEQCTDASCGGNPDLTQLGSVTSGDPIAQTNAIVSQVKADLAPLHVHLDIGRANSDPSTWTDWGDWGGARRGEYGATDHQDGCQGASPERKYLFHFAVLYPYEGHTRYVPGSCILAYNATSAFTAARTISHETGHSLGLTHGGRPKAISLNYKPQYESLMNYGFQWTASFSHGSAATLNPTALDESVGTGLTDTLDLQTIQNFLCGSGGCVNFSTGAVDWNRDGIFSPRGTHVQAPGALGIYSIFGGSDFGTNMSDAAMSWVNAGSTLGDQLWTFGRNAARTLQYVKVAKTFLNGTTGCGSFQTADSDGPITNCAAYGSPTTVAGKTLAFGPGAAELAKQQILLVTQPTSGPLISNVVSINSSTGAATLGANVTLPGSLTSTGDVTALTVATGSVQALAPVGGRLKQWAYQSGAWSGPTDMKWSDGTYISPSAGVGATIGYIPNLSTNTYVVIAVPTAPSGTLEVGYRLASASATTTWTKLSSSWSLIGAQPTAAGRPGIAYRVPSGKATSQGQYYLLFNSSTCTGPFGSGAPCYSPLLKTEGASTSGTATNQRFKWVQPDAFTDPADWQFQRGATLVSDVNRDTNVRAMVTFANGDGLFAPLADGILNARMTDVNDYSYLTGALRSSLALDGGSWPAGVLPASLQ